VSAFKFHLSSLCLEPIQILLAAKAYGKKQIMHRFTLTENDTITKTVIKTPLGQHRTRDLLLPRLLSGQVVLRG
jgi:hypothetical protein